DRRTARLGTAAFALLAEVLLFELDSLLGAAGDFGEGQLNLSFQIEAALRPRAARGAAAVSGAQAPETAEDVVEHREDVRHVHVREVVRPLHARVTVLVITVPLGIVGEDLIRLGTFLELQLGLAAAL